MKKLVALLLICLVAIATVFASGAKEDGTKSYTFAMNCEWPPLEYVDENGEITGFEVDLIKEMSKVSGVEMKYINTAWDTIFAGLANGQYNAVASGVTVTEERKKTIDFSDTLFTCNLKCKFRSQLSWLSLRQEGWCTDGYNRSLRSWAK